MSQTNNVLLILSQPFKTANILLSFLTVRKQAVAYFVLSGVIPCLCQFSHMVIYSILIQSTSVTLMGTKAKQIHSFTYSHMRIMNF